MRRMKKLVHGLPITPARLLPQLTGRSFCLSYMNPEQTEQAIRTVGRDDLLILDNGAFTAWRRGMTLDSNHWAGFWRWAVDIMQRCPQAVAVIPDVIEGSEADNWRMAQEAVRDHVPYELTGRLMFVWHMNESLERLVIAARIFNFIAFGSCSEYDIMRGHGRQSAYGRRCALALTALRAATAIGKIPEHPWLHMMRGLGALHAWGFNSADSCNIAINHHRTKHRFEHVRAFADRLAAKVAGHAPEPAPLLLH